MKEKERKFEKVVEWEQSPMYPVLFACFLGIVMLSTVFLISIFRGDIQMNYGWGVYLTALYLWIVYNAFKVVGKGRKVYWRETKW